MAPEAESREFNMFVSMPPGGERPGDILLADSTIFSTLFGVDESLERFWKNLAKGPNWRGEYLLEHVYYGPVKNW